MKDPGYSEHSPMNSAQLSFMGWANGRIINLYRPSCLFAETTSSELLEWYKQFELDMSLRFIAEQESAPKKY